MQEVSRGLSSGSTPRQVLSKRLLCAADLGSSRRSGSAAAVLSTPPSGLSKRSVVASSSVQLHRVAYQCGLSSPKNTLSRVFSQSRRAARLRKFLRIGERLAGLAFMRRQGQAVPRSALRPRVSEAFSTGTARHRVE
jgi:hypothetical protein